MASEGAFDAAGQRTVATVTTWDGEGHALATVTTTYRAGAPWSVDRTERRFDAGVDAPTREVRTVTVEGAEALTELTDTRFDAAGVPLRRDGVRTRPGEPDAAFSEIFTCR